MVRARSSVTARRFQRLHRGALRARRARGRRCRAVWDRRLNRNALMWSGGKDSALALWRARQRGLRVEWLVNIHDRATGRVRFHATPVAAIELQAEVAGMPLVSVPTDWDTFDQSLSDTFAALVQQGCRGVVFGDIHLAECASGMRTHGAAVSRTSATMGTIAFLLESSSPSVVERCSRA